MRTSPEIINELGPNEVFVFGSNTAGIHGLGAAKQALQFGAVLGEGIGFFGRTYAIPTKDHRIKTLPLSRVAEYVSDFIDFAEQHESLKFLVTRIGCGLAGFSSSEIAPMFKRTLNLENVFLPQEFLDVLDI